MIFNNESPFKLRVIALLQDTTVGCDLDNILDSTYNRHQAKMWYFRKNAQIERARLDYRAKLELKPCTRTSTRQHKDTISAANVAVAYKSASSKVFPLSSSPPEIHFRILPRSGKIQRR
jgi:hypothetical protein